MENFLSINKEFSKQGSTGALFYLGSFSDFRRYKSFHFIKLIRGIR